MMAFQKDLVIYEMNVRAFSADESSGLDPDIRGSYLGVTKKVTLYHIEVKGSSILVVKSF